MGRNFELRDTRALDFVEVLEHVDDLGDEQLIRSLEKGGCPTRLCRRIAGQGPDQNVRVEERAQARVFARASRVRRLISGQGVLRFCGRAEGSC